jgi:hypothetical protein
LILVCSGIATAIFGALVLWGYGRTLKRNEQDENLLNACKGAWHLAVRALAIPADELDRIGVHVWSVRGFKGARFLERRAKFTLQPRRETKVLWRRGIGAIGVAWDRDEAKSRTSKTLNSSARPKRTSAISRGKLVSV